MKGHVHKPIGTRQLTQKYINKEINSDGNADWKEAARISPTFKRIKYSTHLLLSNLRTNTLDFSLRRSFLVSSFE